MLARDRPKLSEPPSDNVCDGRARSLEEGILLRRKERGKRTVLPEGRASEMMGEEKEKEENLPLA